jgi:hypothetical protein
MAGERGVLRHPSFLDRGYPERSLLLRRCWQRRSRYVGRTDVDERAFDRMARLWGTSTDRRRALRLIGAGVIAGFWLGRGKTTAAQTSAGQMTCTQDADCQDGDAATCTGAACQDGFCTFFIVSCIPGTICCGNGECCPVEVTGGCTADTDCVQTSGDPCWRAVCTNGTCLSQRVMCPPSEFCRDGTCAPIGLAPIPVP